MSWRDSASVQVRASVIWPTAAAAWLSSSLSGPEGSFSTARPSAIAPDETTITSRLSRCSGARSSASEVSHDSLSLPAAASTSREEPTFTTIRRKSPSRGVFMVLLLKHDPEKWIPVFRKDHAPLLTLLRRMLLQLSFALKLCLVFKAIIAGQPADQLAPFPVVEDAADVFACDAGHGGEVGLADLLPDHDPPGANVLAEFVRQFEQCQGDASAQRQETSRGDHGIGLAQTRGQQGHQRFVDLGVHLGESFARGAAEK